MAAYRNCYTLIEEGGDGLRVGVGKHLANAVILVVLTDGLSGVAECGDGAQDPLVRLMGEGDRAPTLPTITTQAIEAAVVARARVGIGGDESGRLRALLLVEFLLC